MANLVTTKIILRKAQLWDVFYNGHSKRMGQPFWVKSKTTGTFDNRNYIVEHSTNSRELKSWVEQGMLFVPASDLELREFKRTTEKADTSEQLILSA